MARRRLRHKLMLGLALVVGSIGLLLAGTLYGIDAYGTSVRTTERKIYEVQLINIVIGTLRGSETAPSDPAGEIRAFRERVALTQGNLSYYRKEHAAAIVAGANAADQKHEDDLIDELDLRLNELDLALQKAGGPQLDNGPTPSSPINYPEVKKSYDKARDVAELLRIALIDDITRATERSNSSIRQSIWIISGAIIWTALMILTMLYYFRQWMLTPISVLQSGVQRVHAGDFDHPIALSSGDELEELANEFNAMTVRLNDIYKDLARQVNERSRQLVRSERMVSVGFLAAGVAHEINNPLASILFCSEALERRLQEILDQGIAAAGEDAEVLTRYMKMIQQEALRCKDITQKLLDFSRTGERKRESTDLAGLIRGVLEVARHLPNCRGKNVQFNPSTYVVAPVNAQDLKSVILNLVVNALDSMDDTGSLTITLTANGANAEMAFTDTGCGMAPDVLQNIFEPFFTRSRTGKGTGLGLFISHQIIDQHGGVLEASSTGPGQGSTFTVRVPMQDVSGSQESGDRNQGPAPELLQFPGARSAAA